MSKINFNIGATIHCKDGKCGKLDKLVFDPYTREITSIVVKEGLLFKTDRVLPASIVERATPDDIYLNIKRDRYERFPEYRKYEYEIVKDQVTRDGEMLQDNFLLRPNPYGIPPATSYFPAIQRKKVHENVGDEQEVLEKATPVLDMQENKLGTLDHMLLNQDTCQPSHIIVDRGIMKDPKVIDEAAIEAMTETRIIVSIDEDALEELPSYLPRENAHILSEIQDYLKQDSKLKGIDTKVENGVMTLAGYVDDILIKRRIEAAARAAKGVVDVKNHLIADTAVQASVITALSGNPITEVAVIDVWSEFGIVTLRGKVDDEEIRQVAENVASLQPGVRMVINDLKVEYDELTPHLLNRLGWLPEKSKELA